MEWFNEAFGKFQEMSMATIVTLIIIGVITVVGIIIYAKQCKKSKKITKSAWTTKQLTTAALCIAAAFLLSFIKIFSLPNGGTITPGSMLPIMAFAYIYGFKNGLVVGLCYSMLQFIQAPLFLSPIQFVLDYTLSFSLLALAGLSKNSIRPGILYACGARFVCQFLSGFIFFAMYAPEGMNPVMYSLVYNASIVGVECVICLAVSYIPALNKFFEKNKSLNKQLSAA